MSDDMNEHAMSQGSRITIRLPRSLIVQLQQLARRESNPPSAVVRRLLTAGVARERVDPQCPNTKDDAV
jgi:predicted transcriptional regulator